MNLTRKIAFQVFGGKGWTSGLIHLGNLFHAWHQLDSTEFKLSLLVPQDRVAQNYVRSIKADEIIFLPRHWTLPWLLGGVTRRLFKRDLVIEGIIRKHKVDILIGIVLVYQYPKVITLSWVPDFQHLHLPEMFSRAECLSRDKSFLRSARLATRIILISDSVRKDFESFALRYLPKVRVLPPVSYIPESVYEGDLNSILRLYQLPEKFVFLPNQFWKHKNHELAFRAIKALRDAGTGVFLVCTGNSVDYRHPTYFADLWQRLLEWDIGDRVRYLGLVPRQHVLSLIRQSICVLNPSLFEGWGYTVDEARSVGKQVLVSDIPPHREQNPPKAVFFDPHSLDDLVEKLAQIWQKTDPGPDMELEFQARAELPGRLHAYGEAFVAVVNETLREAEN